MILGIQTTHEWFGGFEKVVDSARWELKSQDSAHIEKWADPADAVWSLSTESAYAQGGSSVLRRIHAVPAPDRTANALSSKTIGAYFLEH